MGLPNHYYAKNFYKITREEENDIAKKTSRMTIMRLMLTHSLNPMNTKQLVDTKETRKKIIETHFKPIVKTMAKKDIMSMLFIAAPEYTSFWLRMVHISMGKVTE